MTRLKNDGLFQVINSILLILISITMIAPIINLAAISLSNPAYAEAKLVSFWPQGFNINVYKTITGLEMVWRAMGVSIWITLAGTLLCLLVCSLMSYSLSRPAMKYKGIIMKAILLTYIFSIPLIPYYITVRSLKIENTLWALIIPGSVGAFYIIIMRTFFKGISPEIYDAARIDGCNEFGIYSRIVLPLSKPVLATISLYHAVGVWNSYFGALVFIRSKMLYPLQLVLRELVVDITGNTAVSDAINIELVSTPEMMKAGIIIFSTVPILMAYPFLQKYFIKGAMLGSLKE